MEVTFKVTHVESKQIRSITVNTNKQENLYKRLTAEIRDVFDLSSKVAKSMRIMYKDAEDDLITFSCNEELMNAVSRLKTEQKSGPAITFKLFLQTDSNTTPTSTSALTANQTVRQYTPGQQGGRGGDGGFGGGRDNAGGPGRAAPPPYTLNTNDPRYHQSVTCNACGSVVFGNRFTCIECEDYDLCHCCFNSDTVHTQHNMLVIRGDEAARRRLSERLRRSRGNTNKSQQQTVQASNLQNAMRIMLLHQLLTKENSDSD